MTSSELETPPLDTARRLAEHGDLDGAAAILAELAADPDAPDRAQAAVGLAVVLEERGDLEGARAAARTALATGHPEYAAQAACHLGQGFEREGRPEQARAAWQAVLGVGTPAYMPLAHLALARLAGQAGDLDEAEHELRSAARTAVGSGDEPTAAHAAQQLAELLIERGEPGEAAAVLIDALEIAPAGEAPRLRVQLGIAHLELACAEFAAALEEGAGDSGAAGAAPDPGMTALAVELLARTLPLRGRDDDAGRVWTYGLEHEDETLAAEVRLRYHRDT
ncbi:tetratricopeptide repeat protein [Nonomuraea pusilla]|uniref:Tetratricopeptide repeat-containing protein n=1 Tax=Nonomuraea pusilla TaxID=46177 RepID=A0A1H7T7L7_9ACTN|nr:tetratricopeptide repeat protein [Nonomuraea pusilla]SEL80515.1 Tetratricopeptide repeat-containing protein [Nonomuraea pusilla]